MIKQRNTGRGRKYRFNIGTVIYDIRKRLKITQREAACLIGVSQHTIFRAESRGTIPRTIQYKRMLVWINRNEG